MASLIMPDPPVPAPYKLDSFLKVIELFLIFIGGLKEVGLANGYETKFHLNSLSLRQKSTIFCKMIETSV